MNFWAAKDTKRTLSYRNTSQVMITVHTINCYHTFENIGWSLHIWLDGVYCFGLTLWQLAIIDYGHIA